MNLENKNAVIYGAGGSLGGAVAMALARAGARVFLTGRNTESVQKTANKIRTIGGIADVDNVDAMDEKAIQSHLEKMTQQAKTVDISFNAIGYPAVQNLPLVQMKMQDFVSPVTQAMQTQFLTATAAGRIMMKQGSGIILTLTATPGGIGYPYTGGFAAVCCATECFIVNLASELGSYGVRAVNIRSSGSPDSQVFKDAIENQPVVMKQVLEKLETDTMLKKLPLMEDIANVAVFLCSDNSRMITGVTIDVTSGTTTSLNYRANPGAYPDQDRKGSDLSL